MTEKHDTERTEETPTADRPTLGETSHTNPYTDEAFGETQTYGRGRVVAADGGADPERERTDGADAEGTPDEERMKDVDHTPPEGGDGAAPAYERGHEGREDPPESEDEDVR